MVRAFICLLAVLALVGCSAVDEGSESWPSSASSPAEVDHVDGSSAAVDHGGEHSAEVAYGDEIVRANADVISPDPELVAAMECEEVEENTLRYSRVVRSREVDWEPQQVLVGEGRVKGELWWVIAFEPSSPEIQQQAFLTTQPGVEGMGQWLDLSGEWELPDGSIGSQFHNVRWDHDRLVRGQSALRKALDCLLET